MSPISRRSLGVLLSVACLAPTLASAQNPPSSGAPGPPRWTVEFFGGALSESRSSGGTPLATFPVGDTFVTEAGTTSRGHASWRFGDGAVLFNQVAAQFAQVSGRPFATITPLDDVLRGSPSADGMRRTIGVRVSRTLTPTWSVDLQIERSESGLTLSQDMQQAIAAANDSFTAAFLDLLGTAPVTGLQVVSDVTAPSTVNSQLRVTGSVTATVAQGPRWRIGATAGGGMQVRGGDAATVTINGRYQFSLFGAAAFFERDEVVLTFAEPSLAGMGLLGLNAAYDLTPGTGLRLSVRAHVVTDGARTTMLTKPFITTAQTAATLPTVTTPALQFSNQPVPLSSLRPAMGSTLITFTGSGLNRQVAITLGLVRRF